MSHDMQAPLEATMRIRRHRWRRLAAPSLLWLLAATASAQSFLISNIPMVMPSALEPNIILTLDDSVFMRRAYAPDDAFRNRDAAQLRRFKSSAFNPLYYNPAVTYVVPPSASVTATSFAAALVNGFDASRGNVNLSSNYRPTYSYEPTKDASYSEFIDDTDRTDHRVAYHKLEDLGAIGALSVTAGAPAYYYVYDAKLTGCTASLTDEACYQYQPVAESERQNFANWYSYYRTRNLAMASAAALAFASPSLQGMRLAFQGLNSCDNIKDDHDCDGYTAAADPASTHVRSGLREFDAARRDQLSEWLRRLPAKDDATPARKAMARAGEYLLRTLAANGRNSAYVERPNVDPPGEEHACRPNLHVMMIGGLYDDNDTDKYCPGAACGNADGSSRTLPDGVAYNGARTPFADGNSNSLADIAFHYWSTDLHAGLANDQLLPYLRDRSGDSTAQYWNAKNDPARWQHMVNFTVGIGLGSTLTNPAIPWSGSSFAGAGYANLLAGTPWPANTRDTNGRAYDLWHAAFTSRGEFFGADSPEQMVSALNAALARTVDRAAVGASVAANASRLTTGSVLYQASFDSRDWTGQLRAIHIELDGSLGSDLWKASDAGKIPAASERRIFATAPAAVVAAPFRWADGGAFNAAIGDENTLNYLRGDQSREMQNGGTLRNRKTRMGDVVNSELAYVGAESYDYEHLGLGGAGAYTSFLNGKAGRTKMLVFGANDGMLHAFNADSGGELFAYMPRAVLSDRISATDPRSKLVTLADPAYTHRFTVDGSSWVADAFWGGAWHTALIGTTGAGGKGVFALDVSSPDSFDAANVLWDLDGIGDPDLGHTIGQPVIGVLNDGHFYAIFGNGYRSTRECAVLYLVRLDTGVVRRISTVEGNLGSANSAATCTTLNGLGRPSLYDVQRAGDGYRKTDYVYAGDLQGNLWKFDLTGDDPTRWGVAYVSDGVRKPLFRARNGAGEPQPITGTIEIGKQPFGAPAGSILLWFGTGRFFAVDDRLDTTTQSLYGVLDRFETSPVPEIAGPGGTRTKLVAQTIDASTRAISNNPVDYSAAGANKYGWYADLPGGGERIVNTPLIQNGRLIVSTIIPTDEKCDGGGTSAIMAFNPDSGARLSRSIFIGTGGDAVMSTVDILRNLVSIDAGGRTFLYGGGSSGEVQVVEVVPPTRTGGPARARTSWREIVGK